MGIEELLGAFIGNVCNVVPTTVRENPAKRWSLGEYGLIANPPARFLEICNELSAIDLDHLEKNFVTLPLGTPRWDQRPIRSRAAFGLYLLVLFASLARDHAADGTLWPKVRGNLSARLVKRHDVPRVDVPSLLSAYFPDDVAMTILNIDIEGDSLNALRQIDLTKYVFDLILIEVDEQAGAVEDCKSSFDIPDYEHVVTLGPTLGFRRVTSELRATS